MVTSAHDSVIVTSAPVMGLEDRALDGPTAALTAISLSSVCPLSISSEATLGDGAQVPQNGVFTMTAWTFQERANEMTLGMITGAKK